MNVTKYSELQVSCENHLGSGAEVFSLLTGLGINVLAFSGKEDGGHARFFVVSEDSLLVAEKRLRDAGFQASVGNVIAVDLANRPGSLVALLRTLSEANIDVIHSYATGTAHARTKVVLQTSDNELARHVISTIPGKA